MQVFDGFESLAGERSSGSAGAPSRSAGVVAQPQAAPASVQNTVSHAALHPEGSQRPQERFRDVGGNVAAAPETAFERTPPRRGAMIAACVLLAAIFLGQLTYVLRGELAARYPAMKTALTTACRAIGCIVSLPQRPELVKIEASDVNMLEERRPALVQLTATLRSYADYDVAYPALDLVLTNATEHALARRIFVPEEYLGRARDPQAGMPSRAEITVALDLDTGDLNAAGFRVDLLPVH
jgi:hypothetical protein